MLKSKRREFLRGAALLGGASAAWAMYPPSIRKALAIPARRSHGDLRDVEHIVILMQENRAFDHYFGTLAGVRGFGDRFPIPVPDCAERQNKSVWYQSNPEASEGPQLLAPFRLNTEQRFEYMRVTGTPHSWPDAQGAWGEGRLSEWPRFKQNHSLGYFTQADIPFQFAMAEAFTLCDAYHCSFQGGTNPNRVFLWTGSNDALGRGHGPVLYNTYDNLEADPQGGYSWTSYCERLEQAGVSWQVYQDMADNFTDNPLAGFRSFRAAHAGSTGSNPALAARGLSTRDLDQLEKDVLADRLPQVSWIVATAEGSEHPGPSSPAQGAQYTARVLDALTANPEVWSKTVLIVNFDENDGFFDHVPPPAAPSYLRWHADPAQAVLAGASTVDTTGEYHELPAVGVEDADQLPYHRPYGLGPRVPMYVLSPWSKGGWVSSEVFDHTSVIRFIEQRFGVHEPNITPWRRAVCGDLTGLFDFQQAEPFDAELPQTAELAERARSLPDTTTPEAPRLPALPVQERGVRPSRALPYELHVHARVQPERALVQLRFDNTGRAAAVFHVYDRLQLERGPRRYTVEAGKQLTDAWPAAAEGARYDLWVLGPNGFHRHFLGQASAPLTAEVELAYLGASGDVRLELSNLAGTDLRFEITPNAYFEAHPQRLQVRAGGSLRHVLSLEQSAHWYDFSVRLADAPGFLRRFAGRVETGRDGFSDPALGGRARGDQPDRG